MGDPGILLCFIFPAQESVTGMVFDQSVRPPNSSSQQEAYDIILGDAFTLFGIWGPAGSKGVESG